MADSSIGEIDTWSTTLTYLLSGTLSGAAGVTASHPFDTIRIRIAVDPSSYRSGVHCFRRIVSKEGYRALYKGLLSPISGVGFQNAILFGTYGPTLEILHALEGGDPEQDEQLKNVVIAGCVAGTAQTLVATPMELVKIRMQLNEKKKFESLFKAAKLIVKADGGRALFRGFGMTLARDMPSYGSWFLTYEILKRAFVERYGWNGSWTPVSLFFAGGLAGVVSWATIYPVDIVKTHVQSSSKISAGKAIRNIYAKGGWRGFFHGFNASIARGFVCSGSTFLAVEAGLFVSRWLSED